MAYARFIEAVHPKTGCRAERVETARTWTLDRGRRRFLGTARNMACAIDKGFKMKRGRGSCESRLPLVDLAQGAVDSRM